jgi:hypothetical protein
VPQNRLKTGVLGKTCRGEVVGNLKSYDFSPIKFCEKYRFQLILGHPNLRKKQQGKSAILIL